MYMYEEHGQNNKMNMLTLDAQQLAGAKWGRGGNGEMGTKPCCKI